MEEKAAGAGAGTESATYGCFFCKTALPLVERCWTEATRDHFRSSRIEFLKGLRSLIDDRIAHLSRQEEPKGTRVAVE